MPSWLVYALSLSIRLPTHTHSQRPEPMYPTHIHALNDIPCPPLPFLSPPHPQTASLHPERVTCV